LAGRSLRRWGSVEGDFGPEAHPWQQSALEIHGAAAFTMLMLVGAILVVHVPAAWRNVGARNHGLPLAIVLLTLVVTAWCMYYLDDPAVRDWTALIHLGFGLALPVLLSVHVLVGRVTRVTNARIARSNSRTDAGK
jgi:hypothetical protein